MLACFHSIPLSQTENSPYVKECMRTAEELGKRDGIPHVEVAWQSQMDKGKWLGPNVEEMLGSMAGRGIKRICAVCPGFFCDCTDSSLSLGCFCSSIRCSNIRPVFVAFFKQLINKLRLSPFDFTARHYNKQTTRLGTLCRNRLCS